jgi:hypothetical protein
VRPNKQGQVTIQVWNCALYKFGSYHNYFISLL